MKSNYIGVTWHKKNRKWYASFNYQKKVYRCGCSDDEREAAILRDRKIMALNLPVELQIFKKK